MSVVKELIKVADNGGLSFGNFELEQKTKKSDFEFKGDIYKVKTFRDITRLEKNELFVYESEPGTAVSDFVMKADGVEFVVEGPETAQVIVGLEESTDYDVYIDGVQVDKLTTNLGGKLAVNVELGSKPVKVKIVKEG
ncbi:MAG: endosialidase [Lachnospiraceae bacterium]|nr:endosialidase [Lachnospiraceae bacterium]